MGADLRRGTTDGFENQAEHHKRLSFKEELQIILNKHGIEYEDWMLD
jgi:hypothetical protein